MQIRACSPAHGAIHPGNPTVVASHMPGAGSLIAANHTYNAAPKDGTRSSIIASSVAVEPYLKNPQARFDPLNFGWLGSMSQEASYCGVWNRPGNAQTWAEVMTKETSLAAERPRRLPRNIRKSCAMSCAPISRSSPVTKAPATSILRCRGAKCMALAACFSSSIKTSWNREVTSAT